MKIPIVDENDDLITYRERKDINIDDIYRVSYLWVTDTDGQILLARRAFNKSHDPGKWGPAVAGTVEEGETYEENIIKEAEEELGLKNIRPVVGIKKRRKTKWNYFSQEFLLTLPAGFNDFKIREDEVAEVGWFKEEELKKKLNDSPEDFLQGVHERMAENRAEGQGVVEVLDSNKVLKTPLASVLFFIAISIFCLLFFGGMFGVDFNPNVYFLFFPMAGSILWLSIIYGRARLAFWKTVATKYGWQYLPFKEVSDEKGLIFKIGRSRRGYNSISGEYLAQPFELFEYRYTTGYGKNSSTFYFTVFEVKFTGTFPHLYLNYKKDWTTAIYFGANMVNISLPSEFTKSFKLYSPKEYEIEALQVFTPDVLESLLDLGWDYDMEFVDGELIIYSAKTFTNFTDLDTEVKRIRQIVDLLAPQLNKMKLSPIGDFSPELR